MVYLFDSFNYWIRLDKGDRLKQCLEQFMNETKLDGAWVSGIGAAQDCELGYYHLGKQEYQWRTLEGLYEILSLQGNLAKNEAGEMMFHLHGSFSDSNYQAIGGHVKDFVAGATVELFVHRSYEPLQRKTNPDVGLQTLDL